MIQNELWFKLATLVEALGRSSVSGKQALRALEVLGYTFLRREGSHITVGKEGRTITVVTHSHLSLNVLSDIARKTGMTKNEFEEFAKSPRLQKEYTKRQNLSVEEPTQSPQAPMERRLEGVLQSAARGVLEGASLHFAMLQFLMELGDPSKREERKARLSQFQLDEYQMGLVEEVLQEAKAMLLSKNAYIGEEPWNAKVGGREDSFDRALQELERAPSPETWEAFRRESLRSGENYKFQQHLLRRDGFGSPANKVVLALRWCEAAIQYVESGFPHPSDFRHTYDHWKGRLEGLAVENAEEARKELDSLEWGLQVALRKYTLSGALPELGPVQTLLDKLWPVLEGFALGRTTYRVPPRLTPATSL